MTCVVVLESVFLQRLFALAYLISGECLVVMCVVVLESVFLHKHAF